MAIIRKVIVTIWRFSDDVAVAAKLFGILKSISVTLVVVCIWIIGLVLSCVMWFFLVILIRLVFIRSFRIVSKNWCSSGWIFSVLINVRLTFRFIVFFGDSSVWRWLFAYWWNIRRCLFSMNYYRGLIRWIVSLFVVLLMCWLAKVKRNCCLFRITLKMRLFVLFIVLSSCRTVDFIVMCW